jgi:hypothetical protein
LLLLSLSLSGSVVSRLLLLLLLLLLLAVEGVEGAATSAGGGDSGSGSAIEIRNLKSNLGMKFPLPFQACSLDNVFGHFQIGHEIMDIVRPKCKKLGCGSGWFRINLSCWIRIRI